MWQLSPEQVEMQLPRFWQVMSQLPPAHEKRQLPVPLQVKVQPPPGQSYSQLPIRLHEQLVFAAHVPVKLPTVVVSTPHAATPRPTRTATRSPFDDGLPVGISPPNL